MAHEFIFVIKQIRLLTEGSARKKPLPIYLNEARHNMQARCFINQI